MNFKNLPANWKVVRLGRVAELRYGKTLPQKLFTEKGYPVFGANGIIGFYKEYLYEESQVLISCRGAYSGVVNLSPPKVFVTNNSIVVDITKKQSIVSKFYLFHYLRSLGRNKLVTGTAQPQVTIENIFNLPIPLPPLSEQKRIVEILSLAEDLVKRQKEAIALIDKILMAKFFEMFGDPATNPKGWEVKKLRNVVEVIMGQSPPSSSYNEERKGIPFLQGKAEFGSYYPTPIKWCDSPLKKAISGDILISVRAPVGDVNVCPFDICIGRGLAALRPKDGVSNTWFLFFLLKKVKSEIEFLSGGSTFQAITKSDIENFQIPLPPIQLQQQFAQIVEEFEKKRKEMQNTLETLESLFRVLQKKAFTGELTAEWREKQKIDWELPKITERQTILLALLYYSHIVLKKPAMLTFAMKETFLLQREAGLTLGYEFIPYKYGPFSKEIYEDLEELEKNLLVEKVKPDRDIEKTEVTISEDFKDWVEKLIDNLPESHKTLIQSYVQKYGTFSYNELIDYVYSHYPEFTTKSKKLKKGK